jgi:hypothetical protein
LATVDIEKPLAQGLQFLGHKGIPEAKTYQAKRTVGHLVARDGEGHRRVAAFGQQTVQDGDEVRRRINERTVQIK